MDAGAGAALPAGGSLSPGVSTPFADDARPLLAARQASHRLAHLARRVATGRGGQIPPELRGIVEAHRDFHPKADIGAIVRAYEAAERYHRGQMRRSGDPYIIHPLAVAEILADLGVDTTTLVAALLHDTVEDTRATLELLTEEFDSDVANLVDGVTKLDKMRFGEAAEAETLRKLIVALAKDYRVLLIKIADRLHNMRTLGFMSPPKRAKISRVTLEILAPLAHRLGVSVIKRELEDRAFEVLDPEAQRRTQTLVDDFAAAEREGGQLMAVVTRLRAGLGEAKIVGDVSVRTSHLFSIHKRAQERGRPPRDYYDIVRVLVLVDDVRDCYAALGVIHGLWRPVPGRLRDFVATPKFNMYQSLHTTVTDPAGRAVDIQIRTKQMHVLAETGIVARPLGAGADSARLEGLAWLHSLLDWQDDAQDPGEFLESLSSDLDADEVLAFTPKGKAIALPARSSPVDVAYAVHTDIGHRAIGARVNGRLVPLHTRLRNGDVVEILTSNLPQAGPSEDWLAFVRTARARVRIRRRLARGRRDAEAQVAGSAAGRSAGSSGPTVVTTAVVEPRPDGGVAVAGQPGSAAPAAARATGAPSLAAAGAADPAAEPRPAAEVSIPVAVSAAGQPRKPVPAGLNAAGRAQLAPRPPSVTAAADHPAAPDHPAAAGDRAAAGEPVPTRDPAAAGDHPGATADPAVVPDPAVVADPAIADEPAGAGGEVSAVPARTASLPGALGAGTPTAPGDDTAGTMASAQAGATDGPARATATGVASTAVPGQDTAAADARAGHHERPTGAVGRRPTPPWAGVAAVEGQPEAVPVRIARCCLPLPGDRLIGFVTTNHASAGAVTLHRAECPNTRTSGPAGPIREPVRVLSWRCPQAHTFPAEIGVEAFDRYGLLADITEVLSDTAAGLRAASTSTSQDRVAHARFTIEVTGPDQLAAVLAAVRTVGGVYDCFRACQTPV
jgi:GTP pyrophosphokinase